MRVIMSPKCDVTVLPTKNFENLAPVLGFLSNKVLLLFYLCELVM